MTEKQTAELLKTLDYIHSTLSRIDENTKTIREVSKENRELTKKVESIEQYLIGISNSLDS